MNKLTILTTAIALTIITGCNIGSAENQSATSPANNSTIKAPTAPLTPAVVSDDSTKSNGAVNPAPVINNVPTATTPPPITTPAANSKNLNPEHGQPGHRCDIAVGAPLNSAPTTTATTQPTTTVTTSPVKTTITPSTKTGTVAKGLNPAHGEPGHRCDIPVGTPLDAQPTKTTEKPTSTVIPSTTPIINTTTTPVNNPSTTPVINTSTTPVATATGKGLNPAHGQPGHRCEIAVGAPLDSKPIISTGTDSGKKN